MIEVRTGAEVTVNSSAAWRARAGDELNCSVVSMSTPAMMEVSTAAKTHCSTATCRLRCGRSRTTWLLIILGSLAVSVLVTAAVVGLTLTTAPLTADFNGNISNLYSSLYSEKTTCKPAHNFLLFSTS